MINKEEEKLKKMEKNADQKTNDEKYNNDNDSAIKKNLIEFLEIQVKESQEKIIEHEIKNEKEIMSVYNRSNKEIEKSRKFSLEKLITDFLPIFDNIERALDLIKLSKSKEEFIEIENKLKFICNLLKQSLTSFNIKKIDDINVSFNPSIHQAMSIHYTNEIESNQIVTVMQPGYILHESRLLRPAMVIVSKKKI